MGKEFLDALQQGNDGCSGYDFSLILSMGYKNKTTPDLSIVERLGGLVS